MNKSHILSPHNIIPQLDSPEEESSNNAKVNEKQKSEGLHLIGKIIL